MAKKVLSKSLAIANGYSGTTTIVSESDVEVYMIQPASPCTLGGNAIITLSGTPVKGDRLHFTMKNPITIGAYSFTILGVSIGTKQMASGFDLLMEYNGTSWTPYLRQDFSKTGFIGGDKLAADIVDGSSLELVAGTLGVKDAGITLDKLQNFGGDAKLLLSGADGVPVIVTLGQDVTIDHDGNVTIANNAITTGKIIDEAVTTDKMADLAEGSVLIGNSSSRPAAVNCKTAGYLLLGNGTTIVPVTLSGDVTIAASGAVTIANNAITTAKILDANVTLAKIANIGAGKIILGNASGIPTAVTPSGHATIDNTGVITLANNSVTETIIADGSITPAKMAVSKPVTGFNEGVLSTKTVDSTRLKALLDGTLNNLFSIKSGEIVIAVQIYVQTAHGVAATCNVGVDANARSAGASADGIIKTADLNASAIYKSDNSSFWGALQKFGYFEADGDGNVTIQSSINCSSGALVSGAIMLYLAKG